IILFLQKATIISLFFSITIRYLVVDEKNKSINILFKFIFIYLVISFQYHPDAISKSRDDRMQATIYLEIKDAYEVLKDKKKRQDYDSGLMNTFTFHPTYGNYNEATGQSSKKYDSSNFYARTPQYDNEKWYEWYQKRRRSQMEVHWARK
ncbi:unnamed protein product, partial [Onchocerca flexuosa]|uniref:J domain-containing protein n=1 Tax=Onchocerca flexuosa TaxID=387005 RepID=A0A183H928_9BILA